MQDHWQAAEELWAYMAKGDLASARAAANRIAEVENIQGLAWDAGPYLREMRHEAENVADANQFEDAALSAGRMAVACGNCHARTESGPTMRTTVLAASDETVRDHMLGHQWAMDRMWEGLVLPSRDRWITGARVLAEHPVSAMGLSESVGFLAARVHEQGLEALDDKTAAARGDRFGRILADCAACHAEMGLN
jgi:cytochrome c553